MAGDDDRSVDGTDSGTEPEDELVRRLRTLHWPTAPPEVRERCFHEMKKRLAEMEARGELQFDSHQASPQETNGSLSAEQHDDRFG